jgi:putative ABC transport system permease protein
MALDGGVILLALVGLVCLGVLLWAGRKRFPLRIGVGNFFRRKTQVAIVVAGLLIGTSIITSSFVIQSTFDYTIRSTVFRTLDHVDETVTLVAQDGTRLPFSAAVFDGLNANRSAMPTVDALAPRLQFSGAVVDDTSVLFEPSATIVGFDPAFEPSKLLRQDGSSWDGSGLNATTVAVNERLAKDIEAKAGDSVHLAIPVPRGFPRYIPMTVLAVVQDSGLGAWANGPDVFVRLDALQAAMGMAGQINLIVVSNVGGVTQGYLRSDDAVREVQPSLPATPTFTVSKVKADQVDQATSNVDMLSQIFVLLGSFTIIAGVLLIINIFVMLAEERKGEMGVARALGMRRTNLVQSFVAEGLLYALLSAAVGTFGGLLIAGAILWGFELVFPANAFGGMSFVLTWTWLDLIRGFAIGFLITMGTIALASWRVSKLNIVRAIRDIPEPAEHRSTRRQLAIGASFAVLGVLMTVVAILRGNLVLQDLGPSALALGLAILTMRVLSPRVVFTAAGLFIVGWMLSPWKFVSYSGANIELFIQAGLLLVFGGLLVIMFNSDTLLAVATRVVRGRTWRPVIRTAIAYPMNKKFRTGATLASIALVMFTIATMSGIQSLVDSTIQTTTQRESAGYNLLAQSLAGIPDWPGALANYTGRSNLTETRALSDVPTRVSHSANMSGTSRTSLVGMPQDWQNPPFAFQALDSLYADSASAWAAVQGNSSLAIIDGSAAAGLGFGFGMGFGGGLTANVGDVLYYRDLAGAVQHVQIIGILYEQFTQGLFVGWDTVRGAFNVTASSLFYIKVRPGVDVTAEGHALERYFVRYQMLTLDFQSLINQILEIITGVFNLLQAYLALGLVVGIAGLGVITMRNVVERRQETGALRALGFRKSMVLKSYLLELSFIALTGILLGTVVGVALSYDLFLRFFAGQATFTIPWVRLLTLGAIALLGSVLATASPAIRASRMPPAEALRTFE